MKLLKMVLFILLIAIAMMFSISLDRDDREQKMIDIVVDGARYKVPFGTTFSHYSNDQSRYYADDYLLKNGDIILTGDGSDIKDQEIRSDLVSINEANVEELIKIPGIGEKTALKIIEYREEVGGFRSLDELMNVPGIKEKKYGKIKDYISI